MSLNEVDATNEYNKAIDFAIKLNNKFINKYMHKLPPNCHLRPRETDYKNVSYGPIEVIFDIFDPNSNRIHGIITINDAHYTYNGTKPHVFGIYRILCCINNYNGVLMEIYVDQISHMFEILEGMTQIVKCQKHTHNAEFVLIPPNLLTEWYIPEYLKTLNRNALNIN